MKWFKKQETAAAATQLRGGQQHPFGMLEGYSPMADGNIAVYR